MTTPKYARFVCADCGETLPVSKLSMTSLRQAGTNSRLEAIKTLPDDDLLCINCCVEWLWDEEDLDDSISNRPRTEVEAWNLSGLRVDPARWQAYMLNY